jgi:predicted nucleotidyltransferase
MTMTTPEGTTGSARVRESSIRRALPHLGTAERADIERIVDALVRAFEPEAIYVFGSQARWAPSRDSDVDLFVVVRDAGEFPHHLAQEAYRLIGHHLVPLDIVFMSRPDFEWRSGVPTSLPATVAREGKLLHGAS